MMIEQAKERLASDEYRKAHAWVWPAQKKELHDALPDASEDTIAGFELGLEAARIFLEGNVQAVQAKVSF
jgi:hypothetical protein